MNALLAGRLFGGGVALSMMLAAAPVAAAEPIDPLAEPDRFAWSVFMEISADAGDGNVVWETWANAREVFANPNQAPTWPDPHRPQPLFAPVDRFDRIPLQQELRLRLLRRPGPLFDPLVGEGNETRMNRATLDFIVREGLFSVEGQEAFFESGRAMVFPKESREIKAQWRKLTAGQDPKRFHTHLYNGETWGLTALHITTKDLPNWLWATWEHADNPRREAVIPSRDSYGTPPELRGTKWENYVLRGTQVDFVDSRGMPTRLANSLIEAGFEDSSSCISCHALATIGPRIQGAPANRLFFFDELGHGPVGPPDPGLFTSMQLLDEPSRAVRYVQTDFLWSLFRAQRER